MCKEIWNETQRADNGDSATMHRGKAIGLRCVVTEFTHAGWPRYTLTLTRIDSYGADGDDLTVISEFILPKFTRETDAIRQAIAIFDDHRAMLADGGA